MDEYKAITIAICALCVFLMFTVWYGNKTKTENRKIEQLQMVQCTDAGGSWIEKHCILMFDRQDQ